MNKMPSKVRIEMDVFFFFPMGPKSEAVSTRPKPCGKAEFTCSNRKCIPAQLQCDLFDDCGDGGSDEQDCKACMCSKLHAIPNLSD